MRAEQVVYTLLAADAGVAALVGTRIYPGALPQGTALPALVYQHIDTVDLEPITAAAGGLIARGRVQVNALVDADRAGVSGYAQLKALGEAVRLALSFRSGLLAGVQVVSVLRDLAGSDQRDDDLGLLYQSSDYVVTHYV